MQYYNGKKVIYHAYTVEPDEDKFDVYGHSFYPESSTLSGQQMKVNLGSFDSVQEAKKGFPKAEVLEFRTEVHNSVDHLPESDW